MASFFFRNYRNYFRHNIRSYCQPVFATKNGRCVFMAGSRNISFSGAVFSTFRALNRYVPKLGFHIKNHRFPEYEKRRRVWYNLMWLSKGDEATVKFLDRILDFTDSIARFFKHVLICNLIQIALLFLLWVCVGAGEEIYARLNNIVGRGDLSAIGFTIIIIGYLITGALVYLFYRKWAIRTSLFLLPISYLFLTFLAVICFNIIHQLFSDGPGMVAFLVIIFYTIPFTVLTFIISLITKVKSRKITS